MTYSETIEYLYSRLPVFHREGKSAYKSGLGNIESFCEYLGNPHQKFKSVHIAGTNGKGSTSHYLAAIFQSAGYKTGLYTSPHLKSFTERIRINGVEIPEEEVICFVKEHQNFTDHLSPSFFEFTVGMAFDYFAKEKVDIAIIEVGLGGRLDSTNIILPELSIITNIGYDHTDLLGNTLSEIAFEKAGIIKKSIPVVIGNRHPETENVFLDKAVKENVSIYFSEDYYKVQTIDNQEDELKVEVIDLKSTVQFSVVSQLLGNYQCANIVTVLTACKILNLNIWNLSMTAILKGISEVVSLTSLKGRWQILNRNPLVICDTAHNEHGFKEVLKQIESYDYKDLYIILGFVKDKDFTNILKMLPTKAKLYFTETTNPRTLKYSEFSDELVIFKMNGEYANNVNSAIKYLISHIDNNDCIYVGGSNFVVAEIENL